LDSTSQSSNQEFVIEQTKEKENSWCLYFNFAQLLMSFSGDVGGAVSVVEERIPALRLQKYWPECGQLWFSDSLRMHKSPRRGPFQSCCR
jgi:hypothetical protein